MTQGFKANPGLELANAFGVMALKFPNAFGVLCTLFRLRNSHPLFAVKAGNVAMGMTAIRSKRVAVERSTFSEIN
jgi:hypothetical protein